MNGNAFDGFIEIGRVFMAGLKQGDPNAVRFKRLLGVIDALLADTHELVIAGLARIERAKTLKGARESIDGLRGHALSQSFHAEGLCDSFVGLGYALEELANRAPQSDSLPDERRNEIRSFARMLMDREQEVAARYGHEIAELRQLIEAADQNAPLEDIRKKAKEARKRLTDQMADFRALASKFQRLSRS